MERLFIAIKLPPEIKKTIYEHYIKILKSLIQDNRRIKIVKEENLHITLHFLGDTDEENKIKLNEELNKICDEFTPFELTISGFGCFPNYEKPRVLWYGVSSSDNLKKLYEKIGIILKKLDFKVEKRDYHPHLTIARINDKNNKKNSLVNSTTRIARGEEALKSSLISLNETINFSVNVVVEVFALYKSILKNDGPTYIELYDYPLKKVK